MATSSSSREQGEFQLTSPGQRSGEGAGSVLPYLHDSLASKPAELFPSEAVAKQGRSLAGRVGKAFLFFKKSKKERRKAR
jgi:hypothetical protein